MLAGKGQCSCGTFTITPVIKRLGVKWYYLDRDRREHEAHRVHYALCRNKGTFSIWSLDWQTPKTIRRPF